MAKIIKKTAKKVLKKVAKKAEHCSDCKGTGLKDQHNLCASCHGKGIK